MKTPTTQIIAEPRKDIGYAGVVGRSLPAALTLATGILLFGPASLVGRLGLAGLMSARRDLVGAVCVMAFSVLVVTQLLPLGVGALVRRLRHRVEFRKGTRRLRDLSRSEKNLLNQFLARNRQMLVLDVESTATRSLQRDGIIDRVKDMEEGETGLGFTLRPWARAYLRDNVHLVENERTSGSGPARVTDIRTRQEI
jgi:hypothetical protein